MEGLARVRTFSRGRKARLVSRGRKARPVSVDLAGAERLVWFVQSAVPSHSQFHLLARRRNRQRAKEEEEEDELTHFQMPSQS